MRTLAALAAVAAQLLLAAAAPPAGAGAAAAVVAAVGAESQYADVIAQVGGRYVRVSAVETNPGVDPHSFEASPSVAREVAGARLVVQNGLGYDDYMSRIEAASPSRARHVVDVGRLLGLPDSTFNPHLWYAPRTMPAVAAAVAGALAAIDPSHAAAFRANAARFARSLSAWTRALAAFARDHPHTPVATTEPVGDYMLAAAGAVNRTPRTFEGAVMNGVDPAPQDVAAEQSLLSGRRVRALVYNQQVTDALTSGFVADAARAHVPVVGVYETMPAGYHYQSWMLAEVRALRRAVEHGISTARL